ncbi:SDR family NAD(P)-dependent oxidoreductase [Adhaeretor mobilis]|uniref:Ketoacyl reductase n=1 Tax=Adhaeretor mobilis TaxID=1930276 RepID=A0A517MYQ4_9BACT|nr:SDR family oxidoreductase [Adhaeretor mobilis]QDT00016.1 Putative ketoacyl reductase [Adhaeretor mobilis]
MRQLEGKIALVTGAASGIGRAITRRLAAEGMRLYVLDVNAQALTETVSEAKQQTGDVLGRHCDVSQPKQITAAVQHLLDRWGGVDLLVNNAGITYYGRTDEMADEHWERLMAINLHAPVQFTRELLPTLLSRDESHVLNIASICGLVGLGRISAYTTSKFGLVGFSESLRAEYGRRSLGVTAMCPGLVDTNLFTSAPLATKAAKHKTPPKFLLCTPEKIANRCVRAVKKNHGTVVMQPYARLLHATKRVTPGLLDFVHRFSRKKKKPTVSQPVVTASSRRAA